MHRYSLWPNDGIKSQLQKAQDVPDVKRTSINGIENQIAKPLRIERPGRTTGEMWKQPCLGTLVETQDEGPGSFDSLWSDSAPKKKLPEFSSEASHSIADSEAWH